MQTSKLQQKTRGKRPGFSNSDDIDKETDHSSKKTVL